MWRGLSHTPLSVASLRLESDITRPHEHLTSSNARTRGRASSRGALRFRAHDRAHVCHANGPGTDSDGTCPRGANRRMAHGPRTCRPDDPRGQAGHPSSDPARPGPSSSTGPHLGALQPTRTPVARLLPVNGNSTGPATDKRPLHPQCPNSLNSNTEPIACRKSNGIQSHGSTSKFLCPAITFCLAPIPTLVLFMCRVY